MYLDNKDSHERFKSLFVLGVFCSCVPVNLSSILSAEITRPH